MSLYRELEKSRGIKQIFPTKDKIQDNSYESREREEKKLPETKKDEDSFYIIRL